MAGRSKLIFVLGHSPMASRSKFIFLQVGRTGPNQNGRRVKIEFPAGWPRRAKAHGRPVIIKIFVGWPDWTQAQWPPGQN
jgi:hypothetical protein